MANTLSKFFNRLFGTNEQMTPTTEQAAHSTVAAATVPDTSIAHQEVQATDASTLTSAAATRTGATALLTPAQTGNSISSIATTTVTNSAAETVITASKEKLLPWKPALQVDSLYFDWIMGYPGEGSNIETEQAILQALYKLLASDLNDAVIVPRMPSVIPQLLNSLRSKTISAGELSRQIVRDVVLVGEVINTVNSALYNPADRINSLEKAVMILGEEGLRLVIGKVAFRPIINLNTGQFTRRAAPHIWNQSEKCAIACHTLAHDDIDPFHAFLTGLMKNVGLIIAFRLLDQTCEQGKFKYSAAFQPIFSSVAATLSYRIAQRWEFPEHVILALQQQAGGRKPIDWSPLGHLLHTADLISKMRLLVNHGQLNSADKKLRIGLNQEEASCFDMLNEIQLYDTTGVQQHPADVKASEAKTT